MVASGNKKGTRPKAGTGPRAGRRGAGRTRRDQPDPSDTPDAEVRFIQPYQAVRTYLCPGCNRDIPPSTGHMVVVPPDAPDLRRHWHRGCWANRGTRY